MRPIRLLSVVLLCVSTTLLGACRPPIQQPETLVFLVRHAERADDGSMTGEEDPHLSDAGFARAGTLAQVLKDSGITRIHSTDFLRTRETAEPTARAAGLEIEIYDHRSLEDFAADLRSTPGRHLVVGHSNSTPALVEALGGDPGTAIGHLEYDRLYLLDMDGHETGTVLIRYGEPYGG